MAGWNIQDLFDIFQYIYSCRGSKAKNRYFRELSFHYAQKLVVWMIKIKHHHNVLVMKMKTMHYLPHTKKNSYSWHHF